MNLAMVFSIPALSKAFSTALAMAPANHRPTRMITIAPRTFRPYLLRYSEIVFTTSSIFNSFQKIFACFQTIQKHE